MKTLFAGLLLATTALVAFVSLDHVTAAENPPATLVPGEVPASGVAATSVDKSVGTPVQLPPGAEVVKTAPPAVVAAASANVKSEAMSTADAGATVENYFNAIGTFKSRFSQHTTGEQFTQEGVFYL